VLKPGSFAVCLLVAPALIASGCGSTETASTSKTAGASASTSAPSNESTQTAAQSTGSTGAQNTVKAREPKAPKAKPTLQEKAAEVTRRRELTEREKKAAQAEAPKPSPGFAKDVPRARRYPPEISQPYYYLCEAGKGSPGTCECILVKLELTNVEKGRSIAELLAVEVALKKASLPTIMNQGVALPENARRAAGECGHV
jgi:hypothetical protein